MPRHKIEAAMSSPEGVASRFALAVLLGALGLLNLASVLASLLAG